MEPVKMDVTIDADDMYRFQMYHTYRTGQGILSIVLGVVSIAIAVISHAKLQPMDIVFYVGVGLIFFGYYPVSLKRKAPMLISGSPILSHPLHYTFDEKGITVEADATADVPEGETKAFLPWENVFKAVSTKDQLLIYSNKVNAYILPLSQVKDYEAIKKLMTEKLPEHRISLK